MDAQDLVLLKLDLVALELHQFVMRFAETHEWLDLNFVMTEEHLPLLNVNLIAQEMSMVGLVLEETLQIQAHALKFAEMVIE